MFNNLKIMKKRFSDTTVVMFRAYWFGCGQLHIEKLDIEVLNFVYCIALLGNTFYYRCASQNQLYTMSKCNLP